MENFRGSPLQVHAHENFTHRNNYLRHGEGYVFIVVRCFVCSSVCLLATLRKTAERIFMKFFREGGTWYKEQLATFQGWTFSLLNTEFFPSFFSEQSMPLSSIAEKRLNDFSWNFQKRTDMTQGAIWNIFGMLRLTPWILGRFIYFLDPCLFVILWKNGWTDFHEIFMKRQAWHKK